jgi:GGDEF domain-containing protein
LRRAEQHFETVVASLDEGVLVLDHTGRILSVNPAVKRLLGISAKNLVVGYRELTRVWSEHWEYLVYDDDGAPIRSFSKPPVLQTLRDGTPFTGEALNVNAANGQARWLAISTCRLNPEEGDRSAVLISFRDISASRSATERFAHQALHDPLTGLPNRAYLLDSVQRLRNHGELAAVLFIDLDDLKGVNDSLGHDAGDAVIQAAAQRLRGAVRKDDVVCRFAGDEFVVLLVGPFQPGELPAWPTGRCTPPRRSAVAPSCSPRVRSRRRVVASVGDGGVLRMLLHVVGHHRARRHDAQTLFPSDP